MIVGKRRHFAVLVTTCLAVLLIAVDATVLSLAIPALAADLNPSGTEILWIGDIYSFFVAALLIAMGNLGDRIGRKRLLLIGTFAFGVASAAAAFAPSPGWLITARALLGVAGATLMPSTLSIIRNVFTDQQERTLAIGIWSATSAAGVAVGPALGGLLLDHFWWGSVFLVNVPITSLIFVIGVWALPESHNPGAGRLDPMSVAYWAIGMVAVVYAIKDATHHGPAPVGGASAAFGITTLVIFVWRQRRIADPLVDIRLLRRPEFSCLILSNMFGIFALSGLLFYLSQHLQIVLGYGPLQAGLKIVPGALAAVVISPAAGWFIALVGRDICVTVGMGLAGVGFALLTAIPASGGYPLIAIALVSVGAGAGLGMTVATDSILTAVPEQKAGAAAAVSETTYELGMALGIAILGSVLGAVYRASLHLPGGLPRGSAEAAGQSVSGGLDVAAGLPPRAGEMVAPLVREAFVDAVHITSLAGAVVLWTGSAVVAAILRRSATTGRGGGELDAEPGHDRSAVERRRRGS